MAEPKKTIVLISSEGTEHEVDAAAALECSVTIKNMVEMGVEGPVPLRYMNSATVAKVVEFWSHRHHHGDIDGAGGEAAWEAEFFDCTIGDLCDMLGAANFLVDEKLLDRAACTVADRIKNMSVEVVRDVFGVENDFTPEEEAEERSKYPWAFDACR
ncbi:SKP1-like protein 11 [Ananas comosus]|uniref:SKP1-like protein n=2 Tax=Ananas comosus TaxID=4615 RepID=A0A199VLB9_ANACO|nr:SKP1-like protein 11 [Ananas comosus]CAD1823560.1 unnamed protein product [Ananas comosus var. bracteatus]